MYIRTDHTYTHRDTKNRSYIHTYIHTYIRSNMHTYLHTYIHTYRLYKQIMYTYIYTESYRSCIHTYIHTYRSYMLAFLPDFDNQNATSVRLVGIAWRYKTYMLCSFVLCVLNRIRMLQQRMHVFTNRDAVARSDVFFHEKMHTEKQNYTEYCDKQKEFFPAHRLCPCSVAATIAWAHETIFQIRFLSWRTVSQCRRWG